MLPGSLAAAALLQRLASAAGGGTAGAAAAGCAVAQRAHAAAATSCSSLAMAARYTTTSGDSSSDSASNSSSSSSSSSSSTSDGPPQQQEQQQQHAAPRANPLAAALASEDGAARLCSPRCDDLPAALARAPSLRLLQRHFNISAPGLRGQAVLARVVRASGGGGPGGGGGSMVVDPGYYGLSVVPSDDLEAVQLYTPAGEALPAASGGGGSAAPRPRRGSYLRLRLGELFTPYGDVQLEPVRVRPEVRRKLVWGELRQRMGRGSPVWGRVLNPCAGGYAVGVAGYVALLPSKQASIANIRNIGGLQQFYIHRMGERGGRRVIELSNYADGSGGGGAGGGAGAAAPHAEGADPSMWSNL